MGGFPRAGPGDALGGHHDAARLADAGRAGARAWLGPGATLAFEPDVTHPGPSTLVRGDNDEPTPEDALSGRLRTPAERD
jgi:hypothetical protein